ncbi:hypothetical protein B0I37DRAFT_382547 [Chaetomium sp. MPI-CAGE-AT-0009]|nr:hypothetical protein B0I37DRAFT_382547 [Chaetomium sp. MPI-CAGE-AT-0009]
MPPSKKTTNRPVFERLRKEYGIVFIDQLPQAQWPGNHRDVFESIEKLKGFKYSTYATDTASQDDIPWKAEAKRQARKLVEKSKDLVARNEATWRLACEPLVFSRLASEVACKSCGKRVWRSEVEASLNGHDRAARNLRARQDNRDRCRCPMTTRPHDEDETVGLNQLFIDRAEDTVMHPPDLAQHMPQEQKPDRIYGLRQTRNIEGLLLKRLGNGGFLEDLLHKQPHSPLGEALLFPFLVVEAKAGNAPDDWYSIRLQTAFPIYTYLNTQQSLRLASAQRSRWISGPLVWFFMSRGDDWRLCLAFQTPTTTPSSSSLPSHTTNMVQVWAGCITNRDDALQLFLIVDYMSDWARDVYRAAVITELRILAAADADVATVFTDTDIFSSYVVPPPRPVAADEPDNAIVPPQDYGEVQAAFKQLDSRFGVVRHAAPIESRFLALFITEDNVQTFVMSTSTSTRLLLIRRILDQFSILNRPSRLTTDKLSFIEEMWTGHARLRTPFHLRGTKLYTVYVAAYHLLPSWDQRRDLCFISITDEAFEVLVTESKLKNGKRKPMLVVEDNGSDPVVDDYVVDDIRRLKLVPFHENLLACISRVCGRTQRNMDGTTLDYLEACDATIWELVSYIYQFHKKGDLEPDVPFFRTSTSWEVQPVNFTYGPGATDLTRQKELQLSDHGAVLVHGEGRASEGPSSICVYLARESITPPSEEDLANIIKQTFEDYDVYHTTRNNGTLNLRTGKRDRDIWNLKDSYGVFFSYGGSSFVKWLRALDKPLPTKQGAPRVPEDMGHVAIFEREYSPWHDPRIIYGGPSGRRKQKFLGKLLTAEAMAWARIAQQSIREGKDCCMLCAGERDDTEDEEFLDMEHSSDIELYDDLETGAEDSGDNMAPMPSPSIRQGGDEGDGATSIPDSEPESGDGPRRGVGYIENRYGRIKGLCWLCNEQLSVRGYWDNWAKEVIKAALRRVISASAPNGTQPSGFPEEYCITTPPFSPIWRRRSQLMQRLHGRHERALPDSRTDGEDESEDWDSDADIAPIRLSEEDLGSERESPLPDREERTAFGSTSSRRGKRASSAPAAGEEPRGKRNRLQ